MNLTSLQGGGNDCYWNFNGKCTNPAMTPPYNKKKESQSRRDWDSKMNCVFTQIGVPMCSGYLQEGYVEWPSARNKRIVIEILKMFGLRTVSKEKGLNPRKVNTRRLT